MITKRHETLLYVKIISKKKKIQNLFKIPMTTKKPSKRIKKTYQLKIKNKMENSHL